MSTSAGTAAENRARALASFSGAPLDVLVVGGGIVGAGVARDAALRGMRVGLVEQHDFAFGTSSRSSRLLHGGLRYLAQGRLGLVHEASVEKKVLHRIAPHLAQPLPFLFPVYAGNPHWVLWQLKAGVKLYDLLCGGRNLGNSSWLNEEGALREVPGLNASGLRGAVKYFDALTSDARLTLDTLTSAAEQGAALVNYCRLRSATPGSTWSCELEERGSGRVWSCAARCVVNATGPWSSTVAHSAVKLRLTKGVHLVVERSRLPTPEAVVMTEGKRILFAIPWGERTILGTTDTDYAGPPEAVRAEGADIAYILEVANRCFPAASLGVSDVVSAWAGVRPLIATRGGKPSDVSRAHQILNPEPGWWDVAGGKLTTYRLIAEQTVDRLARWLAREGAARRFEPCSTAERVLVAEPTWSGIIPPEFSQAAVRHFVEREWAMHLEDVMLRRSGWGYYFREPEVRRQAAAWMSEMLGWSSTQREEEVRRCEEALQWGAGA